jgi:hypothetical protein
MQHAAGPPVKHFAYFWDQRAPYAVKHDIERRTGTLLERDPAQTQPLVYAGRWVGHGPIELRLEAAMLNGTLYSLRFDALTDFGERFRDWLLNLAVADDPQHVEFGLTPRYQELVRMTLAFEAQRAAIREDDAAIADACQAVLRALRSGKRYQYTAGGPEGIRRILIQLEDGLLVKRETGEQETVETWPTEHEMLAFLRAYFDFAACRDTFPHKPPETEIWKYIGHQLK